MIEYGDMPDLEPALPPGVGEPYDGRDGCLHSAAPDGPLCGASPTVHIEVYSASWEQLVSLPACDAHAPVARAAGRLHREHVYTDTCADPCSRWPVTANECVIPIPPHWGDPRPAPSSRA